MPAPTRGARLAVLGTLALVAAPTVPPANAAACPGAVTHHSDGWTEVTAPPFAQEPEIIDYAAPPLALGATDMMLAANDREVMRTLDGGCTWETAYNTSITAPVLESPLDPETKRVVAVEIGGSRTRAPRGYVLVRTLDRPIVANSTDMSNWTESSVGLPPAATARQLRATIDPLRAYVLVDMMPSGLAPGELYTTTDGGLTWSRTGTLLEGPELVDFVVDPVVPESLWGWTTAALLHSKDAGKTWRTVSAVPRPVRTVGISHYPPADPAVVTAYDAETAAALRSVDGGQAWRPFSVGEPIVSAASVSDLGITAIAGDDRVKVHLPALPALGLKAQVRDMTPRRGAIEGLSFQHMPGLGGLEPVLLGMTRDAIWRRRVFDPPPPPPPPAKAKVNLIGAGNLRIAKSALVPAHSTVTLQPGQQKTLRYQLDMAPTPTPLDIFFLTDSTGSMSSTINALRGEFQDIINDLASRGIDAWFGVGDFRDYPLPSYAQPTDWPYKRHRAIGPIDDELRDALANISTGGGNGDDSALAATWFAATGEGQAVVPVPGAPSTGGGWWVEPGLGAEFRPQALKVMVVAADVESRDPQRDPGYPGPNYSKVIQALNSRGIKHVGLAVGNWRDGDGPLVSLSKVSRGTRTFSPEGGVDCDGDGGEDIPEGEPLVCELGGGTGRSLGPAMTGLLSAVRDLQPVQVDPKGDRRVLRTTSFRFEDVDVKQAFRQPFDVTVRCDEDTAGAVYPMSLSANTPSRPVASATINVECVKPPVDQQQQGPPLILGAPPLPLAAVAIAPPPPPPPAPNVNPNPNPNPNPQVNPQTGMAMQEDQQLQLALITQEHDGTMEEVEELGMVGLPRNDPGAEPLLAVGLAAAAGAGAWQLQQRRRTAVATVRTRRR